jgi:hypothetical protein
VENIVYVQETFELSCLGPALSPVMTRPLYVGHRAVRLSLLVIVFGGAESIRLTRLLILLVISVVEGRLLDQGILVGNDQHLLGCPRNFHG